MDYKNDDVKSVDGINEKPDEKEDETAQEFSEEEFNDAVSNFVNSKDPDVQNASIQIIQYYSNFPPAASKLVTDPFGEIQLIPFMYGILMSDIRYELVCPILSILTNCILCTKISDFFFSQNLIELFDKLVIAPPRGYKAYLSECISTYSDIYAEFLRLLHQLSLHSMKIENKNDDLEFKHYLFWCKFVNMLLVAVESDINVFMNDAFTIITNVINKTSKIIPNFINNDFPSLIFLRIKRCDVDFESALLCLSTFIQKSHEKTLDNLPVDWPENLFDILVNVDPSAQQKILNFLLQCCDILDFSSLLLAHNYAELLSNFSQDATFESRKLSLKILLNILTDPYPEHIQEKELYRFIMAQGSLEFLLPYFEIEDREVNEFLLEALSHVINDEIFNSEEGEEYFNVFTRCGEIRDYIEEIAMEDDPEGKDPLVETANLILSITDAKFKQIQEQTP